MKTAVKSGSKNGILPDNALAKQAIENIAKIEREAQQKKLEQLEGLKSAKAAILERMNELTHQLQQIDKAISAVTGEPAPSREKRERRDWSGWKLVANLPYSVASPIVVELAQSPGCPQRIVVTLQLEVGQRLVAQADDDDYGVLSLLMQLRYEPVEHFKIPAECFFPAPDVDSMCVTLARREQPLLPIELHDKFDHLVKLGFSQRRKMMMKLLKKEWSAEKLTTAFEKLGLSPQIRAEKVSLKLFVELTRILFNDK